MEGEGCRNVVKLLKFLQSKISAEGCFNILPFFKINYSIKLKYYSQVFFYEIVIDGKDYTLMLKDKNHVRIKFPIVAKQHSRCCVLCSTNKK